jgi:hypothetical protein
VAGWRCGLGCSPPTPDGDGAVLVVLADKGGGRVGQVAGSAQLNLAPWRRGRPPVPGGRGGGSVKQRSDRSRTSTATGRSARLRDSWAESSPRRRQTAAGPGWRAAVQQRPELGGGGLVGVLQGCRRRASTGAVQESRSKPAARSTGRPSRRRSADPRSGGWDGRSSRAQGSTRRRSAARWSHPPRRPAGQRPAGYWQADHAAARRRCTRGPGRRRRCPSRVGGPSPGSGAAARGPPGHTAAHRPARPAHRRGGVAGVPLSPERAKPHEGEGWHRHGRAA